MKTFLAFLISFLTLSALSADINETNIPIATVPATTPNDYVRVLTNASPNIAAAKTRLLKIGDLLSLRGTDVWTNDGSNTKLNDTNTSLLLELPLLDFGTCEEHKYYPVTSDFQIANKMRTYNAGSSNLWLETLAVINSTKGYGGDKTMTGNGNGGLFAIYGTMSPETTNMPNTEQGVAVIGEAAAYSSMLVGVSGISHQLNSPIVLTYSTNVGVFGLSYTHAPLQNVMAGGYFSVQLTTPILSPQVENAVLLVDSTSSGYPLIIARTNNGTTVFKVSSSGEMYSRATNFILGCTDGIGSWYVGILPDGTITTRTNTSP